MKNKKVIVIISVFLILVLAGAILAYLYFMTDVFKSDRELFAKYFVQNLQELEEVVDLQTAEVYKNLNYESKYESDTTIKLLHSEGGEVSNPLNNLAVKLNLQKNLEEQYFYVDGQLLYENEEYLEAEIIKEQQIYGVRFKDAAQQFIAIEKDEKFEDIANEIGIEASQLEKLTNIIDGSEQTVIEEQAATLKDKYWNIIITAISNGTFEKQKNAIITYNNVATETNAYSVSLSSEQVENMLLEILNNIKSDAETLEEGQEQIDETINKISEELEVPTIKITVFEQKEKTIRTVVEIGLYKIEIESAGEEGEKTTRINYSDLNNEQVIQYNSEITKKNLNNQEDFEIVVNVIEGEENYTITLLNQMKLSDNKIELNAEISHKQDITTSSIIIENEINMGKDIENVKNLETESYILLNTGGEQKRKAMIDLVKKLVSEKTVERIGLLIEKMGMKDEDTETAESEEMPQVEINKFNAKFEFYIGDEVSAENVKMLLDVVKNNLGSYEILNAENEEDSVSSIRLNIEKDVINENDINEVLQKINDNKKYKILIKYKETNGLIDYITISEI